MNAATLVRAMEARGARLSIDGNSIEVEAVEGALSAAMIETLRTHKADVLTLLRCRPKCHVCGSPITPPVSVWWGGDPVHRECREEAWRRACATHAPFGREPAP